MYESKPYKLLSVKQQTHDNYVFRIKCDLNPMPGQFVEVNIPGVGEAPISNASYNDKALELSVRIVGNVTYAMTKLKKGDNIMLRGPYGNGFPMHYFKGNNIILVGGGCGTAPMKGVIEYLDANRHDFKDIIVFFGYRSSKDVLFKHHLKKWEEKFVYNMSIDSLDEGNKFGCYNGFVTRLVEDYTMDNKDKIVLMCGPKSMMNATIEILKKKGFNDDQIFVSYERQMKCCTGKCGHCMIRGTYVCKDGPVYRWDYAKGLVE